MTRTRSELRFILYAGGIFVCYFIFAMLQEKITRGKYGDGEKFTCTLSLVWVQCLVNYIFAQILMVRNFFCVSVLKPIKITELAFSRKKISQAVKKYWFSKIYT